MMGELAAQDQYDPFTGMPLPTSSPEYLNGTDAVRAKLGRIGDRLATGLGQMFGKAGRTFSGKDAVQPEVPGQVSETESYLQDRAAEQGADLSAALAQTLAMPWRNPLG